VRTFVPTLAAHADVGDQDLLEKDVRLRLPLQALAEDKTLDRELIFRGDTRLIKWMGNRGLHAGEVRS